MFRSKLLVLDHILSGHGQLAPEDDNFGVRKLSQEPKHSFAFRLVQLFSRYPSSHDVGNVFEPFSGGRTNRLDEPVFEKIDHHRISESCLKHLLLKMLQPLVQQADEGHNPIHSLSRNDVSNYFGDQGTDKRNSPNTAPR